MSSWETSGSSISKTSYGNSSGGGRTSLRDSSPLKSRRYDHYDVSDQENVIGGRNSNGNRYRSSIDSSRRDEMNKPSYDSHRTNYSSKYGNTNNISSSKYTKKYSLKDNSWMHPKDTADTFDSASISPSSTEGYGYGASKYGSSSYNNTSSYLRDYKSNVNSYLKNDHQRKEDLETYTSTNCAASTTASVSSRLTSKLSNVSRSASSSTKDNQDGKLSSKLSSITSNESIPHAHSSDSSTLNYSLGKLDDMEEQGGEEESTFDISDSSRVSSNYMNEHETNKKVSDDQVAMHAESNNVSNNEVDDESSASSQEGDNASQQTASTATTKNDIAKSIGNLRSYVEMGEKLMNAHKISSCPSSDSCNSSLMYSLATETGKMSLPKILSNSSSDSDNSDSVDPSDLVASTLAECRLLLQMSPPPSPYGGNSRKKYIRGANKPKLEVKVDDNTLLPEASSTDSTTLSSPDNSTLNSSTIGGMSNLSKFLKCPCCTMEFAESGNRAPLHSFACDHIVCQKCVFQGEMSNTMVPCPECGEEEAFDKAKPVVSRSYCNLVKSIESYNVRKNERVSVRGDMMHLNKNNSGTSGRKGCVPSQIRVFSPSSHHRAANVDKLELERKEENESNDVSNEEGEVQQHRRALSIDAGVGSAGDENRDSDEVETIDTTRESSCQARAPTETVDAADVEIMDEGEANAVDDVAETKDIAMPAEDSGMANADAFSAPPKEPATPVSRAEFRFLQRKEKLEQSLEKVNRILERSKINKKAEDNAIIEETVESNVLEGFETEEVAAGDESKVISLRLSKSDESQEMNVDSDDSGDDVKEKSPTSEETNSTHAPAPRKRGSMQRLKPQLRIDTGVYSQKTPTSTAHVDPSQLAVVEKPTPEIQVTSLEENIDQLDQRGVQTSSVDNIFRKTASSSSLVSFGAHENNFASSSTSSEEGDNAFLLGASTPAKGGKQMIKPSIRDRLTVSTEKQRKELQKLTDDHRCPQFLPSLTYSTMQEADEFVGLVSEKESPMWSNCARNTVIGRRLKQTSLGTPQKFFRQLKHAKMLDHSLSLVDSYDESHHRPSVGFGVEGESDWKPKFDNEGKDDTERQNEDGREQDLLQGPTYDFSEPSCSLSASSDDEYDLKGALVTHKPKFHKRVLSKLVFKKGRKGLLLK